MGSPVKDRFGSSPNNNNSGTNVASGASKSNSNTVTAAGSADAAQKDTDDNDSNAPVGEFKAPEPLVRTIKPLKPKAGALEMASHVNRRPVPNKFTGADRTKVGLDDDVENVNPNSSS